jgi:UPF0176 protein
MYTDGPIQIASFYRFTDFSAEQIQAIKDGIEALEATLGLHGLVILGTEGINTTLSFSKDSADAVHKSLNEILSLSDLQIKTSFTHKHPFNDLKVKIRDEIVTLGRADLKPDSPFNRHLSPDEWDRVLREEDVIVLDTRNDYEYQIGHFKGALNPKTREFTEFPQYLQNADLPKDKKILIYCTGGIRCEKAILEMEQQGYQNVYQLEGGILNYVEKHPNKAWQGECFVFDYRVAVDQDLKPSSTYRLCPHCGQPGKTRIDCDQCGVEATVCDVCLNDGQPDHKTCSKNCAHHFRMGHKSTRVHWDGLKRQV